VLSKFGNNKIESSHNIHINNSIPHKSFYQYNNLYNNDSFVNYPSLEYNQSALIVSQEKEKKKDKEIDKVEPNNQVNDNLENVNQDEEPMS